jgi:hypothetical protein
MDIIRKVKIGEIVESDDYGKLNLHMVAFQVIGEDYARVHWNDKSQEGGVSYSYIDGEGTTFDLAVTASHVETLDYTDIDDDVSRVS